MCVCLRVVVNVYVCMSKVVHERACSCVVRVFLRRVHGVCIDELCCIVLCCGVVCSGTAND